jgi:sulfur-oxidizing protein SoxZ
MAFARIQLPPSVKRGDAVEVRISIRHPMETGFRVDDLGKTIARNTIKDLVCRYNGIEVFRANLGSGIAANPYLRFFVTATESGEFAFEWIDDAGERGDARAALVVAA